MLRCLPLLKACNQQVDYIDKRHCNLFSVPDDVIRYANTLEELMLDANQIRELPRGLFRLQELRKLTLSDNEICRLPPDVANFTFLQELDISRNDIEDIPENIKYCKNLQVADFSSNPLQRLPDGFTHLKNLTHLGLNDVSLTRLPTDIGSLSNLESLELRENLIKYLPASLSCLVKLKTLDLGSNLIDELPATVGSLPSLEELWLDCNEISELPPALGNLKNLTQLDVSENKLEQLPEEIAGLTQLTDFILSQNHLEYLPEGLGNLRKLLILKVDQNQLICLTPTIGNCECIQELLLTENLLTELPASIGRLTMLTILNLDRNQLAEIPREIGNCQRMSVLSLRDNRIARLPSELGNLRGLHVLDICGNRLQSLPLTLGSCSLKAVWLSENQIQPLLKFQTEVDESTGLKVLTCFLLPQQAYQLDYVGGAEPSDALDWTRNSSVQATSSSVKFAGDDDVDAFGFEESHFVRHNTPHPRELRARHGGKVTRKDTGDVNLGSSPPPTTSDFASAAATSPTEDVVAAPSEREALYSNESQSSRSSQVSVSSRGSTVRDQRSTASHIDNVDVANDDNDVTSCSDSTPGCSRQCSAVATATVAMSPPPCDVIVDSGSEENDAVTPADRQERVEDRHVEFSAEVADDSADRESTRLQRRDTPHHLKNKRVNTTSPPGSSAGQQQHVEDTPTAADTEDRVRRILARQIVKLCESFDSGSSAEQNETADTETGGDVVDVPLTVVETSELPLVVPDVVQKVIRVLREPGVALGMSVAGGIGAPPDTHDEGIFITRVADDGPSSLAGLRAGDRLLSVNGTSVNGMDHQSVVGLLKKAGTSVCLVVSREVIPVSDNEAILVTLERDENGLGFTIAGGHGSTPYRGNDQSIYISRVTDGGAADRDGRLRVGDKLISVNGIDITVAPHDQAVALLTGIRGEISLVVSRDQHDVTPQPTNLGASPTVTWPTTPLDSSTELPIIVQPPTPNYAAVESPSNARQPPAVANDAADVAMDSSAVADVKVGVVADIDEPVESAETGDGVSEPLSPDLMDFSTPPCELVTSRDDVITAPDTAADIDVQLRTRAMMPCGDYEDVEFDVDDDDDGLGAAAASGTSRSPMSSDIRDMIQHGMLETLRLL